MATTMITRSLLTILRPEINEALAAIAKKHGIAIEVGQGTYGTGESGHFKLELAAKREGMKEGATATQLKAAADWEKLHSLFDLPKDGVGKTIQYGGKAATILGLMPKRSKFPVLVMKEGKEVLLPAEPVAAMLIKAK